MSDMPANSINEAVENYNRPKEKMRHAQEVLARYNRALEVYKELCMSSSSEARQQKLMTYTEIKALGWVLGKAEKTVIKDVNAHSFGNPLGM